MMQEISRKLFGNNTSFVSNILGKITLVYARSRSSHSSEDNSSLQMNISETLEDVVDREALESFRQEFDRVVEEHGKKIETPDGELKGRKLDAHDFDFKAHGLDYRKLFSESLEDRVREIYGSEFKIVGLRASRNYHHSNPRDEEQHLGGIASLWHMDSFAPSFLRVFIPLEDIDRENGPTTHLSRSETVRVVRNYRLEDYSIRPEEVINMENSKSFEVEEGSAYILNVCQFMHRAKVPSEGEKRDMLMFSLVPDISEDERFDFDSRELVSYRKGWDQLLDLIG